MNPSLHVHNLESPFILVIFGITGDLARTKLLPALFSLFTQNLLPNDFFIVGFARKPLTDEELRMLFPKLSSKEGWNDFATHIHYQQGQFQEEQGYKELITLLESFDAKVGACVTRLFYLATPPQNYEIILDHIESTKLYLGCGNEDSRWTRLIIEKPFGKDVETAKELDKRLTRVFEEKQIFRVDHYLGKETVQNMIAFRFANGIFEPVWNKNFIDHIQITWAEKKGVENRGKFFDGVGLMRDVAQNHLLQLVAAVAMEQPKSFAREAIRDERVKVIQAVRCLNPEEVETQVVRGQYEGYKEEKDIDADSDTETAVAMKFFVDTERFKNVPFYLRAAKAAPKNVVEIHIVFIQTCHILFKEYGCPEIGNVLTIRIQPDEGISLRLIAKKPGQNVSLDTVNMHFSYQEEFGNAGADAYEKLLLDILHGDQMLFNRSDELESSWEFITHILHGWKEKHTPVVPYDKQTWPKEIDTLIEKDNKKWL